LLALAAASASIIDANASRSKLDALRVEGKDKQNRRSGNAKP
jgi:hypothetical protein